MRVLRGYTDLHVVEASGVREYVGGQVPGVSGLWRLAPGFFPRRNFPFFKAEGRHGESISETLVPHVPTKERMEISLAGNLKYVWKTKGKKTTLVAWHSLLKRDPSTVLKPAALLQLLPRPPYYSYRGLAWAYAFDGCRSAHPSGPSSPGRLTMLRRLLTWAAYMASSATLRVTFGKSCLTGNWSQRFLVGFTKATASHISL